MEIEFKLSGADYESLRACFEDPGPSGRFTGGVRRIEMESFYYDTPDSALKRAGSSLRFRLENGRGVVAVKSRARGQSGPPGVFERAEREYPASGLREFLAAPPADLHAYLSSYLSEDKYADLIETGRVAFVRRARELVLPGARFELCLDRGSFLAGARSQPFFELECELKAADDLQKGRGLLAGLAEYYKENYSLFALTAGKYERAAAFLAGADGVI